MKTLATGAAGFIGSSLIPELFGRGHEFIATHVVPEPAWLAAMTDASFVQVDLWHDGAFGDLIAGDRPNNVMGEVHTVGAATEIARELFPNACINIGYADAAPYPYATSFDDSRARAALG